MIILKFKSDPVTFISKFFTNFPRKVPSLLGYPAQTYPITIAATTTNYYYHYCDIHTNIHAHILYQDTSSFLLMIGHLLLEIFPDLLFGLDFTLQMCSHCTLFTTFSLYWKCPFMHLFSLLDFFLVIFVMSVND